MAHRRELFDLGMAEGEESEQLQDFEESVFTDEPVAQAIPNFKAVVEMKITCKFSSSSSVGGYNKCK